MLTKADFQLAIQDTISRYPELATRYYARDPIVLQHLEAIGTMLAMLSQSIDVAQSEVFLKARDATVQADAAMRGVVPKSRPARVSLTVTNKSTSDARIDAGRLLKDSRGRPWIAITGADIPGNSTVTIQADQRTREVLSHVVTMDTPFYPVKITRVRSDGQHLCALAISSTLGEWAYADHYSNVAVDEPVFHVEVDDRQNIFARLGMRDTVGVQPSVGDTLTLTIDYSFGAVVPDLGSPFVLTSTLAPQDAFLSLAMAEMVQVGQNPISIDMLRELARYPSIYNENAVFLGEFDFLIRRHYPELQYLSVWNERIEEKFSGMSLDHINTLYVSCLGPDGSEVVRELGDDSERRLTEDQWTAFQSDVRQTIANADDSYRVTFISPLRVPQSWSISAIVGSAYLPSVISSRIRDAILTRYGEDARKRGGESFSIQEIYAHLREQISEIAESGSDIQVTLSPDTETAPEAWRFVTDETLSISVSSVGITTPSWGWR